MADNAFSDMDIANVSLFACTNTNIAKNRHGDCWLDKLRESSITTSRNKLLIFSQNLLDAWRIWCN